METRELTPQEALSYLDDIAHGRKMEYDPHVLKKIIEKALKELEERREMMRRFNEACVPMVLDNETEEKLKAFDTLSKENEKIMKELSKEIEKNRALEIIKSKGIDIDSLKYHKDLEHYNFSLRGRFEHLTQEEYDLLRKVFL